VEDGGGLGQKFPPGDVFSHVAPPLARLVLTRIGHLNRALVVVVAAGDVHFVVVRQALAFDEAAGGAAVAQPARTAAMAPNAAANPITGLKRC